MRGKFFQLGSLGAGLLFALVSNAQPVITSQPVSQIVIVGGIATFSVNASGTGPFTYQWQRNGTNLANGIISTIAGKAGAGFVGDGGPATNATLNYPYGIAEDTGGNLFIADYFNCRIRKVDTNGILTTVAGKAAASFSGDGGAATNAALNYPYSVATDISGNVFIADRNNNRIRRVDANGNISTFAGIGTGAFSGDGGAATSAALNSPLGVATDAHGNLFISESVNSRVRKVDTNGNITTYAGNGTSSFAGDSGYATNAALSNPSAIALDANGNLFIADSGNNRVRKVGTNGIITTFAGNTTGSMGGFSGDGGAATSAALNNPSAVTVDASGNLFVLDNGNHRVRRVGTNGVINTVAGNGGTGFSGDGGAATNATLSNSAQGVVVDANGNLFISDSYNQRIRKVDYSGGQRTLKLNSVSTNNAGNYTVIVSGGGGSVTSSVVSLIIAPLGYNQIVAQPIVGSQMQLTFVGLPATNYAIDCTYSLTQPNWIPQVTNPADGSGMVIFTNSPVSTTNNFWRVRSVP